MENKYFQRKNTQINECARQVMTDLADSILEDTGCELAISSNRWNEYLLVDSADEIAFAIEIAGTYRKASTELVCAINPDWQLPPELTDDMKYIRFMEDHKKFIEAQTLAREVRDMAEQDLLTDILTEGYTDEQHKTSYRFT